MKKLILSIYSYDNIYYYPLKGPKNDNKNNNHKVKKLTYKTN